MKTAEIKKMTVTQLEKELTNFKKEQYNLRFQKVNSQVQNTSRVKIVRRSIAKILTFLNQKKSLLKETKIKQFYAATFEMWSTYSKNNFPQSKINYTKNN